MNGYVRYLFTCAEQFKLNSLSTIVCKEFEVDCIDTGRQKDMECPKTGFNSLSATSGLSKVYGSVQRAHCVNSLCNRPPSSAAH
jgi:hypothetical protein